MLLNWKKPCAFAPSTICAVVGGDRSSSVRTFPTIGKGTCAEVYFYAYNKVLTSPGMPVVKAVIGTNCKFRVRSYIEEDGAPAEPRTVGSSVNTDTHAAFA